MSFLIANAVAEPAAGTAQSGTQGLLSMLPMIVLLVLFMYFMVIRPQSKRSKEHKNLMSSLQAGDEVVTAGGVLGVINKITDNFVVLKIGENSEITVQKNAISTIMPRGTLKAVK